MSAGARGFAAAMVVLSLVACADTGALDRLTEREPDPTRARAERRLALASAYYAQGQDEVARQEARAALQIDPRYAQAYSLIGLIHARQQASALAEESFVQALALAQEAGTPRAQRAAIEHNYGWFLCQRNRRDEGQVQLQRALAEPGYARADMTRHVLTQCQLGQNETHHER